MSCLFNSYDPYFKQPFGAVRAGQSVHLTLRIPEELGYVDPHLVIQKEGKYDVPVHYRMKFDGQTPKQKATVFGYWVNDPERYGVAEFDAEGNCLSQANGLRNDCCQVFSLTFFRCSMP